MPDAESRLTSESLRDLLTGGNRQLALWDCGRLSQARACIATPDSPFSQHSCHWPTSGIIRPHDVAARLCMTATQDVRPLAPATTTFCEVLSVAICSTAVAWAACKSFRRPSYRSTHYSVDCSYRYIRYSLPLMLGGPSGLGRSAGDGFRRLTRPEGGAVGSITT
jgi:hypothetical protein